MKITKRLLCCAASLALLASQAQAGIDLKDIPGKGQLIYGRLSDGTFLPLLIGPDGSVSVIGTFTATLGGFTPTAGATATVSDIVNTSQDVALPAGADIVITNKGTVDVFYRIQAGAGVAVATDFPLKAGSKDGIHITTATHLSVIAPTGTGTGSTAAQLQIQGGTGLFAGYGGGAGGSASLTNYALETGGNLTTIVTNTGNIHTDLSAWSGSKTGGTAGSASALIGGQYVSGGRTLTTNQQAALLLDSLGDAEIAANDGALATLGAKADSAVTNPASSGSAIAFFKGILTELVSFLTSVGAPGDTVCGTDTGSCSQIALQKRLNQIADSPFNQSSTPVLLNATSTTVKAVVSSVAATLDDLYCSNPNASVAYLQIFDVATAGGVTLGTTTPKWSVRLEANAALNGTLEGIHFANGIQVAATTTATGSSALGTALDCNAAYH